MADDNFVDMNMADMPEAVRRQAELSRQFDEQSKAPEVPDEEDQQQLELPLEPEPTKPSKPEVQPRSPDQEDFEQKWRSLQGMYNSQSRQLQDLTRKFEETQSRLETLLNKKESIPVEVKPREIKKRVTDKDRENLGEDLEKTVQRVAMDAADEIIAQREAEWNQTKDSLESKNKALEEELTEFRKSYSESEEARFMRRCAEEIPNFRETDGDQEFFAWLGENDPMSGQPRGVYLRDAVATRNVDRAKFLYTTWQELSGKFNKPEPKANPKVQQQVAPTRTRATPRLPTSQANKIWTSVEIEKFYKDHREALMRHDPDAKKIEAEIDKALGEGRIR